MDDDRSIAAEIVKAVRDDTDCRGRAEFEVTQILARLRAEEADQITAQQTQIERLKELLWDATGIIGHTSPMDHRVIPVGSKLLNPKKVWKASVNELFPPAAARAAVEQTNG